ncbi:MAG: DHH family phosphoesterase, partial [Thermoplasmata archaeon]|nr:DHH family phosphoesterase [Thermoplasmata archaeon]
MPSGPEGFVTQPSYSSEFTKARGLLLAHPKRWRIVYHYDGDGIASACSIARALTRLGYPFQTTPLKAVERGRMQELLTATPGPVLVVDTGASWLDLYVEHKQPVIILDHHRYPGFPNPPSLPDHVALVNPLDWGVDGMSEMCAATLSWLFTVFLDPKNWDNAPWGISGAIADRQHIGGMRGLNARLLEEAVSRSLVVRAHRIALHGPSLGAALGRSIDPYYAGLSGRSEESKSFLQELRIDPARPVDRLEPEEERRLVTALTARLARQGVRPEFCELVARDLWELPSVGLGAEELSNLQNATGRIGTPGLGVAICFGDRS